ncbi:hypothetical protein TRIUR3_21180 [Triticum urartu]|uniref:Uncharacterized protein n=1 Tax=Triticum urartu TaxID=4572 RepID=M7YLU7_TRIUA|nr:hypothetical protein TRIUR3_21180 [Triticum urartu]
MGNLRADLDEQIEQLLQGKPLVEPEVRVDSGGYTADRLDALAVGLLLIEKNEPLVLY